MDPVVKLLRPDPTPTPPIRRGIYRFTCVPTGDFYIGLAMDMPLRWSQHASQIRNKKHPSAKVRRLSERYGLADWRFDALVECASADLAYFESLLIEGMNPTLNTSPPATEFRTLEYRYPRRPKAVPEQSSKPCEMCGNSVDDRTMRFCGQCRVVMRGRMQRTGYLPHYTRKGKP